MSEANKELIDGIMLAVCELPGDVDPANEDTLTLSVEEFQRVLDRLLERKREAESRDAALRALVEHWRKDATDHSYEPHARWVFLKCADQLSVLLDGAREGATEEQEPDDHARGGKWGNSQADLPRRNDGDR